MFMEEPEIARGIEDEVTLEESMMTDQVASIEVLMESSSIYH